MSTVSNHPIRSPVLIGRAREVAAFGSLIEQVKQGHGQVLLLSGEAGIGKSRLLSEGKEMATEQGFLVLEGACFPTDRTTPYAPLLDVLSSPHVRELLSLATPGHDLLARELVKLFPGLVDHSLSAAISPPVDPEQEKRRLFVTLSQFITGLASKQPVLLAVEDLHWSDDTSLDFLHFLARHCARHPLLLVLTYRQDELHADLRHWLAQLDHERLAQEILLTPLSRSEVQTMLQAIFDRKQTVPTETLDALYEQTEGNPFFLEEILKSIVATETMVSAQALWDRQPFNDVLIPRSVQDGVQRRLDRLSDAARQVVMLAAVAGRRFDFAVLQRITQRGEQGLLVLIKELILAQLVVEESDERFAFRHALTREAIYRQLLLRERKALHRTIGEMMEYVYAHTFDARLTEVAYHFYEAGVWEKALRYAQRAGERALTLYAPRAAIEQFSRALKATHHLPTAPLATLFRLRGQAYETLGEFEQGRADYERAFTAAQEAHEGEMQWRAIMDLGFLWAGRDYERAGSFFRQSVTLAETLADPALHAHSLNRLGNWLVNTGQVQEGLEAHQQALDVFQRQHDAAGMAETFDLLGMTLAWSGDLVKGAQRYQEAIAYFRLLGDKKSLISALTNAGLTTSPSVAETVCVAVRSPEECEHDAAEAAVLARAIDWPAGEAYAELIQGSLLAGFGHFGRGLTHVHTGLQGAMEIEHQQWIVAAHSLLGQIYVFMLEPASALHHLDAGLPLAQTLGSAYFVDSILAYQALAYLLAGQDKRAEVALQTAIPQEQEPRTLTERRLIWARGELALAQKEPEVALRIAERLIASAPGEPRTQPIPRLMKLKGEALVALKRLSEAVEALEEAKRGAVERREAPLIWQVHRSLGRVYRMLKFEDQARGAFAAAREGIEELSRTIDDVALREHFLQRALASLPQARVIAPRAAEAETFGGLTAREREVARLVAQGSTSREIADRLVISERTAEGHVNNILGKLGFSTRAQIAAWVIERGLGNR